MNKDLERILEIPKDYRVHIKGNEIEIKGNGKEVKRNFKLGRISLESSDGKIRLSCKHATKKQSKMMGTINAHIKNMIKGLKEDFVYKMEICNVHFPMSAKVEGDKVVIKTFLGEKAQRQARIMPNTKVEIKGSEIKVSSPVLENAGQTAANIEKSTKVKNQDRRVFQDGIFITEKP